MPSSRDDDRPRARGRGRRRALVPRHAMRECSTQTVLRTRSVDVAELGAFTAVVVRTESVVYRLFVVGSGRCAVLVFEGRLFPGWNHARVHGSGVGHCGPRVARVAIGLCMELHYTRARVVTSPVRSIAVRRALALPGPF